MRRGIQIGNGMRERGFGRRGRSELFRACEFSLRVLPGLIGSGIPALAIALPIAAAAAAATTSASVVTARLFAPLMGLGCKAAGCLGRRFIQHRLLSLRGMIMTRFSDRDLLDVRLFEVRLVEMGPVDMGP
jgi:hypothetical protein